MPTTDRRAKAPDTADTPLVPVRPRHDGWTADRQRGFLTALAETGSVTEAAASVGFSARSAYRLRVHPDAGDFNAAWNEALGLAAGRLTALAFERATVGRVKQLWRDGELVATSREPSDKLLMFLLGMLTHRGIAGSDVRQHETAIGTARSALPELLDRLADNDCRTEFIRSEDLAGGSLTPPPEDDMPFE